MNDQNQVKELEQLEIIESNELKIGNAFHAFRFSVLSEQEQEVEQAEE